MSNSFTFAGFTFPRPVADMAIGFSALKQKRESRKVCGGYTHAPTPNQNKGWGLYDAPRYHGLRIERTGYWCSFDDLDPMYAVIVRLPHGRGFLVGWTMGDDMIMSIDADLIADEDDARYCAQSRCESAAEAEAEYQAMQQDEESEDEVTA